MTSASEPTEEQTPQAEEQAEEQQTQPTGGQRQQRSSRGRRGAAATQEAEAPSAASNDVPKPRLLDTYRNEIVPAMMGEFEFKSVMEVPRLQKIVLNVGLGEALTNSRAMESATRDLSTISGQKAIITRARKSIATFKIREGNPIGACVTLRGARMYHFLDRLINTALPRIRDFRGISRRGFDGRGNFSLGIREQIIFPEIDYNQIDRIRGFQVTITTSARNDAEAIRLLELFGMPFVRQT
jgi:large subunit ribosomal protein L5